jgi:hypothetical protein
MKKLAAMCLFLLLGAYTLLAQNLPTIRIVNNTGYPIYFIYISPAAEDEIGDDLLGEDDLLENGQTFTYQLPQPLNKINVYDIILEDEEGNYYIKRGVTVTNNARLVFTMDDFVEEE